MGPVRLAYVGSAPLRAVQAGPAGKAGGASFADELAAAMAAPPAAHHPEARGGGSFGPSLVVGLPEGPIPRGAPGMDWAARQLESQLWAHWLQEALNPPQGGLFGQGFASSVYGDWLAFALAEQVAQLGPGSLSRLLVAQLSASQNR